MLDHVRLFCAACGIRNQTKQIAAYAHFHRDTDCTIGDLVPARPTPEGDTFWGHTAGDVEWWYALPQFLDAAKEATLLRLERDHFLAMHQGDLADKLRLYEQLHEVRRASQQTDERGSDE